MKELAGFYDFFEQRLSAKCRLAHIHFMHCISMIGVNENLTLTQGTLTHQIRTAPSLAPSPQSDVLSKKSSKRHRSWFIFSLTVLYAGPLYAGPSIASQLLAKLAESRIPRKHARSSPTSIFDSL